ncbi:MAG: IclR family transcriptional regulator [Chloroflexi bacterium]|nr:IclR family transcriptional regulator [Chloroflexota bacterium]
MPSQKKHSERYHIRAVERALTLLRLFLSSETDLSATEISKQVDLDLSTTFRLLITLQAQGFVEQESATGKYRLGVTCLELGSRFLKYNDIRKRALDVLETLRNEFGEAVHLTVLDGDQVVYLEKLPGLYPIGFMSSRVGGRSPAYCTGVGKALLAYLPDEEVKKRYPRSKLIRYTDATITDIGALQAELAQVREKGFAVDRQEHEIGVVCAAVPIFDHKGVTAAMSVSGPAERMEQHIKGGKLIETLKQSAGEISAQMGWGRGVNQLGNESLTVSSGPVKENPPKGSSNLLKGRGHKYRAIKQRA